MSDLMEHYEEVLPPLEGPSVSVDRVALVLYSPGLSVFESSESASQAEAISKVVQSIYSLYPDDCYYDFKGRGDTRLYKYHIRCNDVDIQLCTKYGVKTKIDDLGYIEAFGDDEDKLKGYVYEWFNNLYNIRLEWNPNKVDIGGVSRILDLFRRVFSSYVEDVFCKITRIDLAFDYPEPLNPAFFTLSRSRKGNTVWGSRGIETQYIGTRRSVNNLVVYDKKREYKEKFNTLYSGPHLWRVELRHMGNWFIQSPPDFLSILSQIDIFDSGLSLGDWQLDLVLMGAQHWGVKSILNMMPVNTRKRYVSRLRERPVPVEHPLTLFARSGGRAWGSVYSDILSSFGFSLSSFPCRRDTTSALSVGEGGFSES